MSDANDRPHLSAAQLLKFPGVGGTADLAIDLARAFRAACQGLEKIATGSSGRDTAATAQIMRDIAMETLVAVRYGDYADGQSLNPKEPK